MPLLNRQAMGASPMPLTIRTAREADKAELHAMVQEIDLYFRSLEPGASPEDVLLANGERRDFTHTADLSFGPHPFCTTLIAERDGAALGYLAYHTGIFNTDSAVFVAGLFVRKAARSQSVGLALMAEVEAIANQRGATWLTWTVWHENHSAKRFYEGLGGEVYEDDVVMVKRVGN
jgi:GNAT superfamily N-acetyltransferase